MSCACCDGRGLLLAALQTGAFRAFKVPGAHVQHVRNHSHKPLVFPALDPSIAVIEAAPRILLYVVSAACNHLVPPLEHGIHISIVSAKLTARAGLLVDEETVFWRARINHACESLVLLEEGREVW